jgi:hypothetical protein
MTAAALTSERELGEFLSYLWSPFDDSKLGEGPAVNHPTEEYVQ